MNLEIQSLVFALTLLPLTLCQSQQEDPSVMVVRGGHAYDTPAFEEMCQSLEGVKVDLVLTAHLEAIKAEVIQEKYDAILFLNQNKNYPEPERHKRKYMDLAKAGVGMVFLHFTLSSQPEWDEYHDLIGGKWFLKKFTEDQKLHSTYFIDIPVNIAVLDRDHPVTLGLQDFTLTDTYYGNIYMAPDVHPLLGTEHDDVADVIAWTHQYENRRWSTSCRDLAKVHFKIVRIKS